MPSPPQVPPRPGGAQRTCGVAEGGAAAHAERAAWMQCRRHARSAHSPELAGTRVLGWARALHASSRFGMWSTKQSNGACVVSTYCTCSTAARRPSHTHAQPRAHGGWLALSHRPDASRGKPARSPGGFVLLDEARKQTRGSGCRAIGRVRGSAAECFCCLQSSCRRFCSARRA